MKKCLVLLLCLVMVLSSFIGCGKSETPSTPAANPAPADSNAQYEETVYLAYMGDINAFDPYYSPSSAKLLTTNSTFRTLTLYNYDKQTLEPVLLESWEFSKDNKEFTGHLRKGVTFHNGAKFTAKDIEFTWNYAKDVAKVKNPIPNADKMVSKVQVVDDYTVKFFLIEPMIDFADYLQIQIYSKEAFDTLPPEKAGVIGSGPYAMEGRESGVNWTITRFDNYYEGIEKFPTKKFVFKVLPEEATRAAALESGQIDVNLSVASATVPILKANNQIVIDNASGVSSFFVGFNFRRGVWQDLNARKAIAMAINKEDLVNVSLDAGVGGKASDNIVVPTGLGYAQVNPIKYDPAAAKALWSKLNYKEPIKLTTYSTHKLKAEVVQASLKDNGSDVKVEIVESANFNAILNEGNFDLFLNYVPYNGGLLYQPDRYFTKNGSQNQYGYDGEGYTKKADYVRTAASYDEMLTRFGDLEQWLSDNVILFPICIANQICAYRSDVKEFKNAGTASMIEISKIYIPKRSK